MGKKKGKQRRVATQNQLDSQAESLDNELKALSSIYGSSFAMLPDSLGCSVRVDLGFAQDVQKDVSMECEFRYWFFSCSAITRLLLGSQQLPCATAVLCSSISV